MKTISEIKQEEREKVDLLVREVNMFFAFTMAQFHESKPPLQEGDKYLNLGCGVFLPKSNLEKYKAGIKKINEEYKEAVRENKQRKASIRFELRNREALYTGEIDETLEALGEDYTEEEVREIYKEMRLTEEA